MQPTHTYTQTITISTDTLTGVFFYVIIRIVRRGLNTLTCFSHMEPRFNNSDLEKFAEYLGLEGIDSDVFYESYYAMGTEDYDDYEIAWEHVGDAPEYAYD